jgi:catechol 2,3-dioxygenase-like lactoylglutathione lyase family enzyme
VTGPPVPLRAHHLAVRVVDCEVALAFYAGLLGLTELRRTVTGGILTAVWLDAGGLVLMLELQLRGGGPAQGSGHLLALAVDDLAAWEARLRVARVPIADRTAFTLYVNDPDGHRVGLTTFRG